MIKVNRKKLLTNFTKIFYSFDFFIKKIVDPLNALELLFHMYTFEGAQRKK